MRVTTRPIPSLPMTRNTLSSTTACLQTPLTTGIGNPSKRFLSETTSRSRIKEYFPAPHKKGVKQVKTQWKHPV